MSAGKKRKKSDLAARLITSVVAVPILLWLLLAAPKEGFLLLTFVATAVSALELGSMVSPESRWLRAYIALASLAVFGVMRLALGPSFALVSIDLDERVLTSVLLALPIVGLLVGLAQPAPVKEGNRRSAWLVAGPLYIGSCAAALALIHAGSQGGEWVILAMQLAWLSDTGGYFAGRAFGRHKLYPAVSPNKTIEGSIGGALTATAGTLVMHFVFLGDALPVWHAIALGIFGSLLGQAGDLVVSLMKRSSGVKDTGKIVPGHGGLLDRIDALLFTGTATWLYLYWSAGQS